MIFEDPERLQQRIAEMSGRQLNKKPKVFEDTSAFMSIDGGDVMRLGGNDYLVLGNAREGRFGIDDQPKYWVKTAVDLFTGDRKVIKLVFDEAFTCRIGAEAFDCGRSAKKEAEVLRIMRHDPYFMQGESVYDTAGNLVRIIEFIPGPSLYERLRQIDIPHREYVRTLFPGMMRQLIDGVEAIARLHRMGLFHGDIRADHLLSDKHTDFYVWIDFDYEVANPHYDLYCLGNVLLQVAGKGRHSTHDINMKPLKYPDFKETLNSSDMSLMFPHRVANLAKLFPYLSTDLNKILMRFSLENIDRYPDVDTLLSDLHSLFPSGEGRSNLAEHG
jgi:serine/threonine protein kinase